MSVEPSAAADSVAPAWDHRNCTGTEGCPPRCPRFVDKAGTSLLVHRYADHRFEGLVDFYDDYPEHHRSMSLPPWSRPQVESWLERLTERGAHFVAYHGDEVVGHVAYSPTWSDDPELVIFVAEAYQDRGLGTELCRQAMAHAAADGVESIHLDVDPGNQRAIHVYESLGFDVVERRQGSTVMRVDLTVDIVEAVQAPPAFQH